MRRWVLSRDFALASQGILHGCCQCAQAGYREPDVAVRQVEDFTEKHSVSDFLQPGSCVEGGSSEGLLCVKAPQTELAS